MTRSAREAAPFLDEARETFERLRVPPKLARVEQLGVRSAASGIEAAVDP